jgi:hypothetical protein
MENFTEQSKSPPSLTISDLSLAKQLLEITSERGAYRANELRAVGELYEKLSAFLEAVRLKAEVENQQNQKGETE